MIYSIIPPEIIYGEFRSEKKSESLEIPCTGGVVMLSKVVDEKYVIDRVISTSLELYLDPMFQPGKIIDINNGLKL